MAIRFILPAIVALALTAAAVFSMARSAEVSAANLVIAEAWARASPPGAEAGAAYVTIENHGSADERLISATSPVAGMVMLHETIVEDGVSKMREAEVIIPAGGKLEMRPGGMHIMMMGLTAPLKEGETLDLTLTFETAGTVSVQAAVAPIGAEAPRES